ncbi:MAG: sodium:calcium antiporter [Gammaproteobacteria bacterium]|nr:sodium:calcium antiporter [Gammaproteobacteria bacterium]
MDFQALSLSANIVIFIIAAVIIGVFGVLMTHVARLLAAQTGMGEALMGAVFIGASTSLSGITASMTAAAAGHAQLAVSNALGGIAAQTVFLAIADFFYRKANLEHAAASAENLMMSAFLLTLLAILLLSFTVPTYSIAAIHPGSVLLILGYLFGVRILAKTHKMPMWIPVMTRDTRQEKDTAGARRRIQLTSPHWLTFLIYSAIVGVAGWVLSKTGIAIAAATNTSEGLVGGVFTAVSTSLPELVIAVTAVRLKSLTLAVGDIIGGNAFDTLFIAMSDVFYRKGPIYADVSINEKFWLAITILMSGILLMGLLHRERHGIANIGWESFLVLMLYIISLVYIT